MRRLTPRLALLFASLTACSGSKDATAPVNLNPFVGSYHATLVNNSPLPFVVQTSTGTVQLTSDNIIVDDAGTWSEVFVVTTTVTGGTPTVQSGSDTGTWVRSGNSIVLVAGGTAAYSGSWSSNRMDLTDGTFNYVYMK